MYRPKRDTHMLSRDQPKEFWPKPKELNFRRAISAESRKGCFGQFLAEIECCDSEVVGSAEKLLSFQSTLWSDRVLHRRRTDSPSS